MGGGRGTSGVRSATTEFYGPFSFLKGQIQVVLSNVSVSFELYQRNEKHKLWGEPVRKSRFPFRWTLLPLPSEAVQAAGRGCRAVPPGL